jgi:hypothetical protein
VFQHTLQSPSSEYVRPKVDVVQYRVLVMEVSVKVWSRVAAIGKGSWPDSPGQEVRVEVGSMMQTLLILRDMLGRYCTFTSNLKHNRSL